MKKCVFGVACVALSLFAAAPASAQGKTGLSVSTGSTIALHFSTSDKIAIRPGISFNKSSVKIEPTSGSSTTNDSSTFGIGGSVNFYMTGKDKLRPYIAPSYMFQRAKTGTADAVTGHEFGGSIGAQYDFGANFAAFGEIGVSYARSSYTVGTGKTTASGFGTHSTVGVIWFWN